MKEKNKRAKYKFWSLKVQNLKRKIHYRNSTTNLNSHKKECLCSKSLSGVRLCNAMDYNLPGSSCPWNFSVKNTGVGCHFPPPGDLPETGIKLASLASPASGGRFFTNSITWEEIKNRWQEYTKELYKKS